MVDANVELIAVEPARDLAEEVARERIGRPEIRIGDQLQDGERRGVDLRGRDARIRKGRAHHRAARSDAPRQRIEDRRAQQRKIAGSDSSRRHAADARRGGGSLASRLIIGEHEGLVAHDRPPGGEAILVLAERGFREPGRVREEVVGVQLVVPQELEQRAVVGIGAALDGGADHRSGGVAELRREGVRLDLELLHGVDARDICNPIAADRARRHGCVVVDSIDQNFVRGEAAAAGDKREIRSHAEHGGRVAGQQSERERIPAVQRQFEDLFVLDHLAERRRVGFEQWRRLTHFHGLDDVAGSQCDPHRAALIHLEDEARDGRALESVRLNRDRVFAARQKRRQKFTLRIGLARARLPGHFVGDGHRGAGHNSAGAILCDHRDCAGRNLSVD